MKAAIDGAQPDDFFRRNVIDGDVSGVNNLMKAIRGGEETVSTSRFPMGEGGISTNHLPALRENTASNALTPGSARAPSPAVSAARDQVVAYLKGKALGGASDEIGSFSQSGYNKALQSIGDA